MTSKLELKDKELQAKLDDLSDQNKFSEELQRAVFNPGCDYIEVEFGEWRGPFMYFTSHIPNSELEIIEEEIEGDLKPYVWHKCDKWNGNPNNYAVIVRPTYDYLSQDKFRSSNLDEIVTHFMYVELKEQFKPYVWYERDKWNGNHKDYAVIEYVAYGCLSFSPEGTTHELLNNDTTHFMYVERPENLKPYAWYERDKWNGNPSNYTVIVRPTYDCLSQSEFPNKLEGCVTHFMYIERPGDMKPYVWYTRDKWNGNSKDYAVIEHDGERCCNLFQFELPNELDDYATHFMYINYPKLPF